MSTDTPPSSTPVAQHSFACASCNNEAGRVALFDDDNGGRIIRDSFTSQLTFRVGADDFQRILSIILAGNIHELHRFDLEIASFYCPDCSACYCAATGPDGMFSMMKKVLIGMIQFAVAVRWGISGCWKIDYKSASPNNSFNASGD